MNYTLRFEQVGALKLRADVRIPAALANGVGLSLEDENGVFTYSLDYKGFTQIVSFDPAAKVVLIYDPVNESFDLITFADLINNSATAIQIADGSGAINVLPATRILIVNRTVDENPSQIYLPASTVKIGEVKIVDWKGNAGTFPHTINRSGSDTFQGGATTRKLAGDRASTVLHPVPGLGYVA